jgi:outer membrane lipoprotein-sorting protein
MRSALLPLAALFVIPVAARADDAADARALVEKAVKAAGRKPGDKEAAFTWKDKGKFSGGGFSMPYTGDFAFQGPDKYRFAVTGDVEGMKLTFTAVANGEKAWESALGMTQEITGEKLEYVVGQVHVLRVTSLLPLLSDKEFKLATAGEKDVNGKKAAGVTVTRAKKPAVTLYFDKSTGLLVKSETTVKDEFQAWKEVPEEVYYDDYKDVGGQKVFGTMKVVRDGKTMIESTLSDQKAGVKPDPKLFEKP